MTKDRVVFKPHKKVRIIVLAAAALIALSFIYTGLSPTGSYMNCKYVPITVEQPIAYKAIACDDMGCHEVTEIFVIERTGIQRVCE